MDEIDFPGDHRHPIIGYESVSSQCSLERIERPERLHEWLKAHEIDELYEHFKEKRKLSYAELRDALENLSIAFSDVEYNRLFLKINQNRDFKCDWNEFVSYLIFGFQDDDPSTQKEALVLPISSAPIVRKSEHRSSVCCIGLMKNVSDMIVDEEKDDTESNAEDDEEIDEEAEKEKRKLLNLAVNDTPENTGMWITASKEGQVRFWSPQLEPLRSGVSESRKSNYT